jgi:hypothetical protein
MQSPWADQLKALLVGEASRLLGFHVGREQIEPPTILQDIEAELERVMVEAMLCLDLAPNFQAAVLKMAGRGPGAEEVLEDFIERAGRDMGRQIAVIGVQGALDAQRQKIGLQAKSRDNLHPDHAILGDLYEKVNTILGMLSERLHLATSNSSTALRKAMREFDNIRRQGPTNPDQLGALAMVLLRLDRCENYSDLLEQVRAMGGYAVGYLIKPPKSLPFYTPGLMRVVDEIGPEAEPIGTNALALAEELSGIKGWVNMKTRRTTSPQLLEDIKSRRAAGQEA